MNWMIIKSRHIALILTGAVFFSGQLSAQTLEPEQSEESVNESNVHNLDSAANTSNQSMQERKSNGCIRTSDSPEWIDKLRAGTHTRLCNTASWIDSWFGDEQPFEGEKFRGKVSLGFKQDEADGLDPRLRVRLRTKLPNASKRLDAFVGRVEEDSFVSNTEIRQDRLNNVGLRSTNDEEAEWLVGLGYRRPTSNQNGLDFSIGAKISSGLNPYAKVAHRYLFHNETDKYIKTTQTVFWRRDDGYGVSSNADLGWFVNEQDILVLHGSVKYTEDAEQWEWFSDVTWHHSLDEKRGFSTSLYARGEEENPVSLPEFGTTFTYIRPIMRDWLYMELGVDYRWERYAPGTEYQGVATFGVQFEMLLGDYYGFRKPRR